MGNRVHKEGDSKTPQQFKPARQQWIDASRDIDEEKEKQEEGHADDGTSLNAVPERDDIEYFRRYGFESAPGSSATTDSPDKEIDKEHQKEPGSDVAH